MTKQVYCDATLGTLCRAMLGIVCSAMLGTAFRAMLGTACGLHCLQAVPSVPNWGIDRSPRDYSLLQY
jgi:hypothetical protein